MATAPVIQMTPTHSLLILDAIPEGCETFKVTAEREAPFLHAGELAIVDTSDTAPQDGELFLLQWSSGTREVIEVRRWLRFDDANGGPLWTAQWVSCLYRLDGKRLEAMRWADGPYPDWAFREKLIGRVVGVYSPTE